MRFMVKKYIGNWIFCCWYYWAKRRLGEIHCHDKLNITSNIIELFQFFKPFIFYYFLHPDDRYI